MVVAAVLVAGCGAARSTPASAGASLAAGSSTPPAVTSADIPPPGAIWFGSTVDPQTFAITGRLTTVSAKQAFSLVARLPKPADGAELGVRTWFNGGIVGSIALGETGIGDIWAASPGPLPAAGTWRFDLVDVEGSVLATGTLTVTP